LISAPTLPVNLTYPRNSTQDLSGQGLERKGKIDGKGNEDVRRQEHHDRGLKETEFSIMMLRVGLGWRM
jgi:hypothetical protein